MKRLDCGFASEAAKARALSEQDTAKRGLIDISRRLSGGVSRIVGGRYSSGLKFDDNRFAGAFWSMMTRPAMMRMGREFTAFWRAGMAVLWLVR